MSTSPATQQRYVVLGGAGFLGSAIVRALVARGEKNVLIVDVRPPPAEAATSSAAAFHQGDMTDEAALVALFGKLKPDVVIHTASPLAAGGQKDLFERVNVRGTANVVKACEQNGIKSLVFTSSAGVLFDGSDLINVDERQPYPTKAFDAYNDTKARAEQIVLRANTPRSDKAGLKTCALRPAGIFGPGDRQALPGFFGVLESGRTNVQLGDNTNLFDWTYVDNVAHAHLLAADRLHAEPYSMDELVHSHIPARILSPEERKTERAVPTSEKRPSPPGVPDFAADLPKQETERKLEPGELAGIDIRPVARSKWDQFFYLVHPTVQNADNPAPEKWDFASEEEGADAALEVAGQAFHITNGQPMPFWDFPRALWAAAGHPVDLKKVWSIPTGLGLWLAGASENFAWLTRREAQFTQFKVTYSTRRRFYNIEKSRRLLGYEPLVGMEEAVQRSAKWWQEEGHKLGPKK